MLKLFAAVLAWLPVLAAAQDYCTLVAKLGPEVFGTKLQAAPLRDSSGGCAANTAEGSGRLTDAHIERTRAFVAAARDLR